MMRDMSYYIKQRQRQSRRRNKRKMLAATHTIAAHQVPRTAETVRRCPECKYPLQPDARRFCRGQSPGTYTRADTCRSVYATRRYRIRRKQIKPHGCHGKAAIIAACQACAYDACERCHELMPITYCEHSRTSHGRIRMVCPADCRECPHGDYVPAEGGRCGSERLRGE